MTFIPIIERELRVAARKRSTPWFRVLAALLAVVIGMGFLAMNRAMGASLVSFGSGLFTTLTWLVLASTLAAGLFFTADSISEEKREGTLGFLFLTDLRGYDVVGGKLVATSLRGSYALLAVFPVLGVTLLMGGVTGAQFWKSSLALVNALFCSLAAGLLASSLCRDAQRAMTATLLLLLGLCAGGPLTDAILDGIRRTPSAPFFSLSSPLYVFLRATAWGKSSFWPALIVSHGVAWLAFAMACLLVPRTWQDRPARAWSGSFSASIFGGRSRSVRRSKLINHNPVHWLSTRERWQSMGAWGLSAIVICGFILITMTLPAALWPVWNQVTWLASLVMYLWIASNACRFFVDARRRGLMELLLVTPLSSRDIVLGQKHAIFRVFGPPVAVLLIANLAKALFWHHAALGFAGATPSIFTAWLVQFFIAVCASLSILANMIALVWFGMWNGLTSKNTALASLRTLVFAQVIPGIGILFVSATLAGLLAFSGFLAPAVNPGGSVWLFPMLTAAVSGALTIGKDLAFIVWARSRLFSSFRTEAARNLEARTIKTALAAPPV